MSDLFIQKKIQDALFRYGRDLTLTITSDGTYDPATSTVSGTSDETVTVRGRLYSKTARQYIAGQPVIETVKQMAVIEARGLSAAPKIDDFITAGTERFRISLVEPQQGATLVLTYELTLEQA